MQQEESGAGERATRGAGKPTGGCSDGRPRGSGSGDGRRTPGLPCHLPARPAWRPSPGARAPLQRWARAGPGWVGPRERAPASLFKMRPALLLPLPPSTCHPLRPAPHPPVLPPPRPPAAHPFSPLNCLAVQAWASMGIVVISIIMATGLRPPRGMDVLFVEPGPHLRGFG